MKIKTFREKLNDASLKAGVAVSAAFGSALAFAEINTDSVNAEIDQAATAGLTVGQTVVGVIASFVVVGVIIGMVRKL